MNPRPVISLGLVVSVFWITPHARSQGQATPATGTKDPVAVKLISTALTSMTTGLAVSDTSLSARLVRAGSSGSESGTATLEALNTGEASFTFSAGGEQHAEMIDPSSHARGAWSGADGMWHQIPLHNTWTPGTWFAPALLLGTVLNDSQISLANLGTTTVNGEAVAHLLYWRDLPANSGSPKDLALIQGLSTVHVYLDAATNLPFAVIFNVHPDSNATTNIPVEILYSNWQRSSGTLIPFHIQKFVDGNLLDDIYVSGAVINSGLSPSSFRVPAAVGGVQ